jgi:signal peptidase I
MKRYIFIFIIISFIILSLIFIINNKEIIQEQLPIRLLIIKSNSMYPTLEINDIVIIRKANIYNINDIITYSEGNKTLITHRIIDVVDTGVITKGDNNNIEDGKIIEFQNIKGKTIFIINKKYQKIMMILFILLLIFVFFYKI